MQEARAIRARYVRKPRHAGIDQASQEQIHEILIGLKKPHKELPTKYFYDERGSKLFDQISELTVYYPTRTEIAILQTNIDEIVGMIGPSPELIELGSGSSAKTRILLDHLPEITGYLPIDISAKHLLQTTDALSREYPGIKIVPVAEDYTKGIRVPSVGGPQGKKVVFFPGSTIGNFYPHQVTYFLRDIGKVVGRGGGLLIGVDLEKDLQVLHRAYNDAEGVTAEFNLNILRHINQSIGSDFILEQFGHTAFYNCDHHRIEMHLVSLANQQVNVAGNQIVIGEGESILTEVSYKYTLGSFNKLVAETGFVSRKIWQDPQNYFSVHYLEKM